VSGPRCEPKYSCGVHYITLCNAGSNSRYCTILTRHLVSVPHSSCFLYLFISHSRNYLLENVNMEVTYQAFYFIFRFFFVFFAFFRMHFFSPGPFLCSCLYHVFIYDFHCILLLQSVGNSCGDINLQFAEVNNDCTYM
jgi:hypothetical protein